MEDLDTCEDDDLFIPSCSLELDSLDNTDGLLAVLAPALTSGRGSVK